MGQLFNPLLGSAATGIVLSASAYWIGIWVNRKLKSPFANPLAIAVGLVIAVIQLTPLTLEGFRKGGDIIAMFLPLATASLAISIYRRLRELGKNLFPILIGCGAGGLTAIASVWGMCRLFGLDDRLRVSLLPKSVTTPIAMELASIAGGVPAIATAAVLVTGITGVIAAPLLIRLMRLEDPVEQGVAIGTCSHALGTTYAIGLGEVQGAMSGIAIGVTGLYTVLYSLFFH